MEIDRDMLLSSQEGIYIPSHEQKRVTDEELELRTVLKLQAGKIMKYYHCTEKLFLHVSPIPPDSEP